MPPKNTEESKLNLLKANLKQFTDSDLFTYKEKMELIKPICKQIRELNKEMNLQASTK